MIERVNDMKLVSFVFDHDRKFCYNYEERDRKNPNSKYVQPRIHNRFPGPHQGGFFISLRFFYGRESRRGRNGGQSQG
ncbi:MAG: hypothetical protein AAB692_05035 [Patescibacteria group bacterium]